MKSCNRIQRLIDEAERVNPLSFEVSLHLDSCDACRAFADERMRLREMLGALPSITVPANFNGQLKARLEAAKAKKSFAWFSPAVYLRFATATAVLFVAALAVQYSGVFTNSLPMPNNNIAANSVNPEKAPLPTEVKPSPAVAPQVPPTTIASTTAKRIDVAPQSLSTPNRRVNRFNPRRGAGEAPEEFDVPDGSVRPFSVGAQDRVYMRADNAAPVRMVSF